MSRFKDLFEWILPPLLSQGRPSPTNVGKPAAVADWVIVTDIDEHLYHSDLFTLLIRYKAQGTTFIPELGYQMISEKFPGPSEMLCETRTQGILWPGMCKASLFDPMAIEEVNYCIGRHVAAPTGNMRAPPQECRTMPAFSKARLSGPAVAVKGSLRRASPALDRAHRTLLSSPNPLEFQMRPNISVLSTRSPSFSKE